VDYRVILVLLFSAAVGALIIWRMNKRQLSDAALERRLLQTTDAAGKCLFYPYGPWGRGFVVATAEEQRRLFSVFRWATWTFTGVMITLVFIVSRDGRIDGATFLSTVGGVLIAGIFLPWIVATLARLEISPERLDPNESRRLGAQSTSWPMMAGAFVSSILFLGVGLLFGLGTSGIWPWFAVAFGAWGLTSVVRLVILKIKLQRGVG
jgi:hypothetical protein